MIYSSWDIECDRLKLVIMGHFLPFTTSPLKTWKIRKKKKSKQLLEISLFYTSVLKTAIIWGTVPEIRSEYRDTEFFIILGHFLPFYHPHNLKTQNFEKKTKKNLEMSSFYTCVPKITIIWCMLSKIWSVT